MSPELLNAAYATAVDINRDLTVDLAREVGAAVCSLRGSFPGLADAEIEDACRRARGLIDVSIEAADAYHGIHDRLPESPSSLFEQRVYDRCPGFSAETYLHAFANGLFITK